VHHNIPTNAVFHAIKMPTTKCILNVIRDYPLKLDCPRTPVTAPQNLALIIDNLLPTSALKIYKYLSLHNQRAAYSLLLLVVGSTVD